MVESTNINDNEIEIPSTCDVKESLIVKLIELDTKIY